MHGVVFTELEKFVSTNHGTSGWEELTKRAGLAGKMYLPVKEYPDSEIKALVTAASAMINQSPAAILESFGEFIAPSLLKMYGHLLSPTWTALDIIESTEGTVHTVVRVKNPGARPPQLKAQRTSPEEVVLVYNSPRQMCFLAIGIGRGLARQFKENLTIRQTRCMHKGDPECEIVYRRVSNR
jgi:predicted hydrocarbon binding protein